MSRSVRQPFANLYFFPFAAAYAALLLPWSVLAMFGMAPIAPGLQGPLGHAHEMLFGFAMAVVAGYVLGPQPRHRTFWLLGLWLAARAAFLGWPLSFISIAVNVAYVGLLAYWVVPRFASTAKKWRNKAVAPIILGLCVAAASFQGLFGAGLVGPLYGLLLEAILLLSTLMFFMGGRMLAPAVAGHMLKQGREIEARVQPRLEGTVLILMALVLVFNLLPWEPLSRLTALLLMAAAAVTLIRLLRWPVWQCRNRPDLLALMLGYLWLILGWVLIGMAMLTDALPLSSALHALTVGALGTLTLTVMARTRAQRSRKSTTLPGLIYAALALVSVAALARIAAGALSAGALSPDSLTPAFLAMGMPLYLLAAASWSIAFLILFLALLHLARLENRRQR